MQNRWPFEVSVRGTGSFTKDNVISCEKVMVERSWGYTWAWGLIRNCYRTLDWMVWMSTMRPFRERSVVIRIFIEGGDLISRMGWNLGMFCIGNSVSIVDWNCSLNRIIAFKLINSDITNANMLALGKISRRSLTIRCFLVVFVPAGHMICSYSTLTINYKLYPQKNHHNTYPFLSPAAHP